jgi:Streptomyces sporulation and cell division protein, SsgA
MEFKTNIRHGAAIKQLVTLELIDAAGGATPLDTELAYDPRDPFAVSATFNTIAGDVRWTFGRDLLIGGLYEPTGDGDVHVWPCLDNQAHSVVIIELCSPDGEALVQARTADISAFVEQMTATVPQGDEGTYLDVDAAISAIFADEAA